MALITVALSIAGWAVVKYFIDLGKAPKNHPVSCAGCNSKCHTEIEEIPTLGLLRKIN